jgi:glycosyltransferase involved in cell wall biosynthesis
VTGSGSGPLGAAWLAATPGVRVVLDARPLQSPDRAPLASAYLDGLLGAFDADSIDGESFAFLIGADLDDPTERFSNLAVTGRRQLPPTRLLRSGAMTVDPFLLRGAALGAAWRAERSGASGAVYHAVGGGPLPIASGLPVVVTVLDLAPWELPGAFQRSVSSRFGQRLRAQLLREARAVVVGSAATALAIRRLLHVRRDRIHVVRLAPRAGFGPGWPAGSRERTAGLRDRMGLPERYLVLSARFDARLDLATLLRAIGSLAGAGRPAGLDGTVAWPPQVLLVGASPDDRASIARAAARHGIGQALTYAPRLEVEELAGLVRDARGAILPVLSEAAGLPVIEALASGTPVVASSIGPLPELVGPAGLLVEPRDPHRLAVALAAIWADDGVHARISTLAGERAAADPRSWADVARETRAIYAEVGISRLG